MEVTATRFRRELFALMKEALQGTEVCVTYKGERLKLEPVKKPKSKLDRLTPMDIINPGFVDDGSLLKEMTQAWEEDWAEI
jgi:hypothetical protein